jgi:hypothetical protein
VVLQVQNHSKHAIHGGHLLVQRASDAKVFPLTAQVIGMDRGPELEPGSKRQYILDPDQITQRTRLEDIAALVFRDAIDREWRTETAITRQVIGQAQELNRRLTPSDSPSTADE